MKQRMINATLADELISKGWEFSLSFGDFTSWTELGICWEADFTRRKDDGRYDNHKNGYARTPEEAILLAYKNIIEGNRL